MPEAYPLSCESRSNALGRFDPGVWAWLCPAIETSSQPLPPGTDRGCVGFWQCACAMPWLDVPGLGSRKCSLAPLLPESRATRASAAPRPIFSPLPAMWFISMQCGVRANPFRSTLRKCSRSSRTSASDDPPDQAIHAQQIDELERILAHLPVRGSRPPWFYTGSRVIRSKKSAMNWAYRARPPRNIWPERSNTAELCERGRT